MATLKEDIKTQSEWIIKAFKADGFNLDGSMTGSILLSPGGLFLPGTNNLHKNI